MEASHQLVGMYLVPRAQSLMIAPPQGLRRQGAGMRGGYILHDFDRLQPQDVAHMPRNMAKSTHGGAVGRWCVCAHERRGGKRLPGMCVREHWPCVHGRRM